MPPTEVRPVVVFDDSEEDIFMFKRLLERTGAKDPLLLFTDSNEAIKYLGRVASGGLIVPLVCFLDIKMPGYIGFDLLDAFRASEVFDAVAAIMLSSSDDRRDIVKSTAKEAQGYLVKYPSAETLRCMIEEARGYQRKRGAVENPSFKIKANLFRG